MLILQRCQHHGLSVFPTGDLERELPLLRCRAKNISSQAKVLGRIVKTNAHQHQEVSRTWACKQSRITGGLWRRSFIFFGQYLQLVQAAHRVAIEQAKLGLDLFFDAV